MLLSANQISITDWGVISFLLVQLIALIKWIVLIDSRIKIQENDQKDHSKYIEELKADQKKNYENDKAMDYATKVELKRIEDKSDLNDKEAMKRIDGIAQGLVRVETLLETINKKI